MNNPQLHPDTPANFFSCAVLAVKNSPSLLLADGSHANPPAPLLYSFALHASQLPPDPADAERALQAVAGTQVLPLLPPGYAIALVTVRPIPPQVVSNAAAQYNAETPLYDKPGKPGQPFYFEAGGENIFNTHKPGLDSQNRSPRFGILCPYCGSGSIRFTGKADTRTPDAYRTVVTMDSSSDTDSPLCTYGADDPNGAPWQGHCGVSFQATCKRDHVFTMRFIEDATSDGPAIFLVFSYDEPQSIWLNPTGQGSGKFPKR